MAWGLMAAVVGYGAPYVDGLREEQARNAFAGMMCYVAAGCFAAALLYLIIRSATRPDKPPAASPAKPPRRPTGYVGSQVLDMPGVYGPDNADLGILPQTASMPAAGNHGPGRYRVSGVDRASKMDTSMVVQADSAANAKVKGELEGIVVTAVEFQGRR